LIHPARRGITVTLPQLARLPHHGLHAGAGFFLDTPSINGNYIYTPIYQYVANMQNVTGSVNQDCIAYYSAHGGASALWHWSVGGTAVDIDAGAVITFAAALCTPSPRLAAPHRLAVFLLAALVLVQLHGPLHAAIHPDPPLHVQQP